MSASNQFAKYFVAGTNAARPTPPPVTTPGLIVHYYETDTGKWFFWTGSAWVQA